ncbi:MAG: hypothetical protein ACRETX_02550, partial [Steroidobacteraceae bacterium]
MRNLTLIALASLLTACAVGPDYVEPETKVEARFDNAEPATYSGAPAVAQFWTQFDDETLERLVGEALVANHDLRIALSRVAEVRALRRESRLDLLPTVTASGGYT